MHIGALKKLANFLLLCFFGVAIFLSGSSYTDILEVLRAFINGLKSNETRYTCDTCKDFLVSLRKRHCRLSVVNGNQTEILLLSLVSVLCIDSEPLWQNSCPPKACESDISDALPLTNVMRVYKIIKKPASPKINFGTGIAISVVPKLLVHIDHIKPVAISVVRSQQ